MIVTRTPFRISFFGGGTDYPEYFEKHGGAVLATAMNKSIFLSSTNFYSGLFDYSVRIAYRNVECVQSVEEITHTPFREILKHCGVQKDIEISTAAELPSFSGIGSSSSFVVGLLNTIAAHQGRYRSPMDLAYEAIAVERDVLKECVGCQDQVLAAVGGFQLVEFRSRDNIAVHRVPLSAHEIQDLERHLVLLFTGIRRKASHQAQRQIDRIDLNLNTLKSMRLLVDESYEALVGKKSLECFGRLLHRSWGIKRSLENTITNDTIDRLYNSGIDAGAWGGKLLGAGGGGFLLFVVPPETRTHLVTALGNLEEIPIRLNAAGTQILFSS